MLAYVSAHIFVFMPQFIDIVLQSLCLYFYIYVDISLRIVGFSDIKEFFDVNVKHTCYPY